jgi:hypothetical protein
LPDTVLCRAVGLQFGLQNLFPAHVKERALTEAHADGDMDVT